MLVATELLENETLTAFVIVSPGFAKMPVSLWSKETFSRERGEVSYEAPIFI